MMKSLVQLTREKHKDLKLASNHSALTAMTRQVIAIEASEVAHIAAEIPIFFTRESKGVHWSLGALNAFTKECPLYSHKGVWSASHVPFSIRAAPLELVPLDNNPEQLIVAIDENGVALSDSGISLFEDDSASGYLKNLTNALELQLSEALKTHHFFQELGKFELFNPVNLTLSYENGAHETVKGLCMLDEEKLRNLPAENLVHLNKNGALFILHSVLLSSTHVNRLMRQHNQLYPEHKLENIKISVDSDS